MKFRQIFENLDAASEELKKTAHFEKMPAEFLKMKTISAIKDAGYDHPKEWTGKIHTNILSHRPSEEDHENIINHGPNHEKLYADMKKLGWKQGNRIEDRASTYDFENDEHVQEYISGAYTTFHHPSGMKLTHHSDYISAPAGEHYFRLDDMK